MAPRSIGVAFTLLLVLTGGGDAVVANQATPTTSPATAPNRASVAPEQDLYPDPEWTIGAPAAHGLSTEGLR